MLVNFIRSVGDQAAIGGPTGSGIDGWQPVPGRERDDQIPTTECRRARGNNYATSGGPGDGVLDLVGVTRIDWR
jgi:hypothetical protein